ncbi:hypothetical protein C7S15_5556 [Burkholderia cepacia]|nr:hypothetical protein [Burkholderia cepacia]
MTHGASFLFQRGSGPGGSRRMTRVRTNTIDRPINLVVVRIISAKCAAVRPAAGAV